MLVNSFGIFLFSLSENKIGEDGYGSDNSDFAGGGAHQYRVPIRSDLGTLGLGNNERAGMGPTERKFQKSYAKELLSLARDDLKVAEVLRRDGTVRGENILFPAQQAVEKALKAALCHDEIAVPLTHDIYAILQKFDQNHLPPGGYALHDLTPYATIRRYEEGVFELSSEEISEAISAARQVIDWVLQRIKP